MSSAIVAPLSHGDAEFGVIGVYDQRVREFTRSEKNLVESIGFILSMTASRLNSERKLQQQQEFNSSVMESTPTLVLVLDANGMIVRMRKGESPVPFETFVLTKLGERRRVDWSFTMSGERGSTEYCIIGTGVDVTDRFNLEGQLTEAQESIGELKRSVESGAVPPERSADEKRVEEETEILSDSLGRDRRRQTRRAYPYIQVIAPMHDDQLPKLSAYKEIRCRDISPQGFSYVASRPPEYT